MCFFVLDGISYFEWNYLKKYMYFLLLIGLVISNKSIQNKDLSFRS
jgi:hypothetical protein